MARIRTIKPEFYTDEDLSECSIWARFIFPALWQQCDSEGRLEDRPKYLKTQILPYDDQDINGLLDELAQRGFIERYEVDGRRYISVVNFEKHQRITGRESETPSAFPAPPGKQRGNNGETTGKQRGNNGETTGKTGERPVAQERKGKERKGIGRERERERKGEGVARCARPSRSDVLDFARSINLPAIEAEKFFDHFEANGWMVGGKTPMVDWQAGMRNWQRRCAQYGRDTQTTHTNGSPPTESRPPARPKTRLQIIREELKRTDLDIATRRELMDEQRLRELGKWAGGPND